VLIVTAVVDASAAVVMLFVLIDSVVVDAVAVMIMTLMTVLFWIL